MLQHTAEAISICLTSPKGNMLPCQLGFSHVSSVTFQAVQMGVTALDPLQLRQQQPLFATRRKLRMSKQNCDPLEYDADETIRTLT